MREVSAPTRQPITCQPRSISARVELSRRVTPLRACKPPPFPRPACPLSLVTSPAPLFLPPFLSAYSLPRRSDFFTLLLVNTEGLFFLCACWCFLLSLPSSTTTHSRHFYSSAAARRHLCRKNISRKKVRALILSTDLFLPSLQRQSPPLTAVTCVSCLADDCNRQHLHGWKLEADDTVWRSWLCEDPTWLCAQALATRGCANLQLIPKNDTRYH